MLSGVRTPSLLDRQTFRFLRNAHEARPIKLPVEQSKGSTIKHVLVLAAAILIALSSQIVARLGNTENQVNALMGRPTDPGRPDIDGITRKMYKNQQVNTLRWYSF